jgi:hypothetical protein
MLTNYANFPESCSCSQLNFVGVNDLESCQGNHQRISEAASGHISGFPKAAGVDSIS